MKKTYQNPVISMLAMDLQDILTASGIKILSFERTQVGGNSADDTDAWSKL